MANTTNFGWETPDDTDLVKDGAAAIRTLAGAIDTSLVDLKGGTTDQVLAKNSNSDMDFKWVADASGIPATIFDAKGDIIAASAADTAARLAVGANNTVLTADSSTATGLKWATPSSSATYVGCLAFRTNALTVSYNVWTTVGFDDELNDSDAFHSNSTNNSRITIPSGKAGRYLVNAQLLWDQQTTGSQQMRITKNGGAAIMGTIQGHGGYVTTNVSQIATLAEGDYIEVQGYSDTSNGNTIQAYMTQTNFLQVIYLGA